MFSYRTKTVRDRAWFVRLYGEIKRGDYRPYRLTNHALYRLTNHALSHLYHKNSVDLAYDGVSRAKDWVSVDCGIIFNVARLCCYFCFLSSTVDKMHVSYVICIVLVAGKQYLFHFYINSRPRIYSCQNSLVTILICALHIM